MEETGIIGGQRSIQMLPVYLKETGVPSRDRKTCWKPHTAYRKSVTHVISLSCNKTHNFSGKRH